MGRQLCNLRFNFMHRVDRSNDKIGHQLLLAIAAPDRRELFPVRIYKVRVAASVGAWLPGYYPCPREWICVGEIERMEASEGTSTSQPVTPRPSTLSRRWAHSPDPASCRDIARSSGPRRGPRATGSAQARRPPHGRASRTTGGNHAAQCRGRQHRSHTAGASARRPFQTCPRPAPCRSPGVDCDFHPRRHRHRADAAVLPKEVNDTPPAVALLHMRERQGRHLRSSQPAAEKNS
jgi:hypothetical protein